MSESTSLLSRRALTQSLFTVRVERDLRIPMPDGAVLLADRRYPSDEPDAPLVLMRGPYGRSGPQTALDRFVAARGYQVLHVSLRGTSGSGGVFEPFRSPAGDAPATVRWLRDQPWFPGAFATLGTSYLGFSQWELAREHIPEWRAAVIQDAPSRLHPLLYPGGAFALGTALGWTDVVRRLHAPGGESFVRQVLGEIGAGRRVREASDSVPVTEADRAALGEHVDWFQDWLRHPEPGRFWAGTDFSSVEHMPPVVHLSGGWYDFFLPAMLRDHAALVESGREVRLRIGPWGHGQGVMSPRHLRDAFATLDLALRGRGYLPEARVRVFVSGADRWSRSPAWPPPGGSPQVWYLRGGDALSTAEPVPESPTAPASRFRFDPYRPTPSTGGSTMRNAGVVDNRPLEARDDVLSFTGPALPEDLWAVGPVRARVHVRTSSPHADVFVRLCEVEPDGRSRNITDGLLRLTPDGTAQGTEPARAEATERSAPAGAESGRTGASEAAERPASRVSGADVAGRIEEAVPEHTEARASEEGVRPDSQAESVEVRRGDKLEGTAVERPGPEPGTATGDEAETGRAGGNELLDEGAARSGPEVGRPGGLDPSRPEGTGIERPRPEAEWGAGSGARGPVSANDVRVAEVELWPAGHVFRARSRVRVLVAGGFHPRFARNTGTGDQLTDQMRAVDFEVLHDADHPSSITLPSRAPGVPRPR